MNKTIEENYYIKNKGKILKKFDKILRSTIQTVESYFEPSEMDKLRNKIRKEFEQILPDLPFVGSDENKYTFNLIGCGFMLAIIKVLEAEGLNQEKIGKIIYDGRELMVESFSKLMKWIIRKVFFSKYFFKKLKKNAERIEERKNPDDWVIEVFEGNGNGFDFGYNIHECAICKYYTKMGYERYMPYLCISDFATYRCLGIGFMRNQAIGHGASKCDFRYKKGYQTPSGWPPENLIEVQKKIG